MRRTDARTAEMERRSGVDLRFEVSLYKVELCTAVIACHMLAKDSDRFTLANEMVEG
ncbi:hypothetical protein CIAM_45090 (plasmid) [Citrobacter amalonaticus]|nr:hypothetical protein CIAM_45090 [Citrobacter amalonaticus]